MRTRMTFLAAIVAALGAGVGDSATAKALMAVADGGREVPMEVMVTESDIIATATITKVGDGEGAAPAAGDANVPGNRIARIRRPMAMATDVKAKIDKVFANNIKEELEGKEIGLTINNYGGVAATPKAGTKVVVMLKKANDKYFTLPYAKAYTVDVDATTKELEKYTDLDKWAWGKESNGVKAMALLRSARPNPGTETSMVQVAVAVRNVTKEPVFINTYPGDRTLSLKAFWDGTPVVTQIPGVGNNAGQYVAENHTVEIKPGAVAWLSHWGVSSEGTAFSVQTLEGKIQVQASYASSRDGTVRGGKLWKGTVSTPEIPVEIKKGAGPMKGGPRGSLPPIQLDR